MVVFNYSGREINAKIVYYGPGLSGKTTNLERIYGQVPEARRGKMVSMKTRSDRTLFFDFLPIQGGEIKGFRTRYLLYTVPGQVHYNATRKLVLKGTDAIIFVADSDPALREANIESFKNLEENLAEYQLSVHKIPIILQYNKRDVANPLSIEELNSDLNKGNWPVFEGVAVEDKGVWETFRAAVDALFSKLEKELGGSDEKPAKSSSDTNVSGQTLVPPTSEPASFTSNQESTASQSEARPNDAAMPGSDSVVRLSGSNEIWGAGSTDEKPATVQGDKTEDASAAPVSSSTPKSSETERTKSGQLDWQDSYIPPGSRPRNESDGAEPSTAPPNPIATAITRAAPPMASSAVPVPTAVQAVPSSEAPAPANQVAVATTIVATGQEGQVIRVPVELTSGEGVVRIEMVLELHVKHQDPSGV